MSEELEKIIRMLISKEHFRYRLQMLETSSCTSVMSVHAWTPALAVVMGLLYT